MAVENIGYLIGFLLSGEDQSATSGLVGQGTSGQFLCQKVSTAADFTVLHCSTGNEKMIGILQNKPKSGEAANIMRAGTSKAVIGGTITRGDLLKNDSSGRLVTATTGNVAVAQALESGVLNDIRSVEVFPSFVLAP